jgi:hypothetical protein
MSKEILVVTGSLAAHGSCLVCDVTGSLAAHGSCLVCDVTRSCLATGAAATIMLCSKKRSGDDTFQPAEEAERMVAANDVGDARSHAGKGSMRDHP